MNGQGYFKMKVNRNNEHQNNYNWSFPKQIVLINFDTNRAAVKQLLSLQVTAAAFLRK